MTIDVPAAAEARARRLDVVAHGAVNRAILSYALTGERRFLGRFEQAPGCLNVIDVGGADDLATWVVRAVNIAPSDLAHRATRLTQMEQYWREYVPRGDTGADGSANAERAGSLPPSRVVLDADPESGGA